MNLRTMIDDQSALVGDVQAVIKKSKKGYYVRSHKGKNLGGPYKSRGAAEKRLEQVEYFKHKEAA